MHDTKEEGGGVAKGRAITTQFGPREGRVRPRLQMTSSHVRLQCMHAEIKKNTAEQSKPKGAGILNLGKEDLECSR